GGKPRNHKVVHHKDAHRGRWSRRGNDDQHPGRLRWHDQGLAAMGKGRIHQPALPADTVAHMTEYFLVNLVTRFIVKTDGKKHFTSAFVPNVVKTLQLVAQTDRGPVGIAGWPKLESNVLGE